MSNLNDIITEVMKREGWDEFTNHPADRGGPTKWGITLARWAEYTGYDPHELDVRYISEQQARLFYEMEYIVRPQFHRLPPDLQTIVVDAAVHHGVRAASKWVQRAAEVTQDGVVGPKTIAAVKNLPYDAVAMRIMAYRIKLFGALVSKDSKLSAAKKAGFRLQAEFAAGWNNRAADLLLERAAAIVEDELSPVE